jgi:hypothetical protein
MWWHGPIPTPKWLNKFICFHYILSSQVAKIKQIVIYCNMYLSKKSIFQKVHLFIHKWTLETLFLQFIQGLELFNNICFRRMLFMVMQMMVQTSLFHIKTLIITFRISCLLNIMLMRIFPHRIIQPNTFLEYCVCNLMWKYCKHTLC